MRKARRLSSLVSGWPPEAWDGARPGWWWPLELWPGLSPLFPQGHTLRSRPWGTSGDPESKAGPSPNPLCSLLTFSDFNAGAMKNKVPPPPSPSSARAPAPHHS